MITPKYVFSVDIERKDIRTRKKVYSEVGKGTIDLFPLITTTINAYVYYTR